MELTNEFVIERDIEQTWKILNDLEFIAPCMPGAQLTEIEGDEYRGLVKIKVGPITANYKGKASFVEQDAVNKVAKLKAEGRDPRQGNANAMVTANMEAVSSDQTKVIIHTDLGLSGKLASFGRGAIEDVSKKILGQFTDNLRDKLATAGDLPTEAVPSSSEPASPSVSAPAAAADAVSGVASAGSDAVSGVASAGSDAVSGVASAGSDAVSGVASAGSDAVSGVASAGSDAVSGVASAGAGALSGAASSVSKAASGATASASGAVSGGVRKIASAEPEAVDLLAVSGTPLLKRLLPTIGVGAIGAAIIYWLINRS